MMTLSRVMASNTSISAKVKALNTGACISVIMAKGVKWSVVPWTVVELITSIPLAQAHILLALT
jgi:hypothetical protein